MSVTLYQGTLEPAVTIQAQWSFGFVNQYGPYGAENTLSVEARKQVRKQHRYFFVLRSPSGIRDFEATHYCYNASKD